MHVTTRAIDRDNERTILVGVTLPCDNMQQHVLKKGREAKI